MGDAGGEGGPVEQGGGQDVEGVEPAAGLADVLHDEVARIVRLEPLDLYFIFFTNIIESIYKKLKFNYIFIYTLIYRI